MGWLVAALLLICLAGVPGLFFSRQASGGERLACLLTAAGSLCGLIALTLAFLASTELRLDLPWSLPGGVLALRLDPLTAVFLLPLFLVVVSGSIYGLRYWPQRENPANGRKLRLFYGLISGAMILVFTARNSLLFLMAWEVMALSGFFLITTEEHKEEARRAGYIYLIATHTGTLALFALFALLSHSSGSLMFPAAGALPGAAGGLMFLLALAGFGMKAGLIPLHIWLPGAHAAAPSHASALLSGVMIKTGIYGLLRVTSFFSEIPAWWGWCLLILGAVSGILGVALAIAQHDIKRLLAYHSVENIGIIAMGFGLALLGRSYQQPALVMLGLSGCLLHVINHGLFKSLLFLSAGSVIHATGSREIDRLGGLFKRLPWSGTLFLGAAVAICGLPPLNGFVSEWLVYLAAFQPLQSPASSLGMAVLVAPALALIGGLALACFVKVFGAVFLGEARSAAAQSGHEAPPAMLAPMFLLLAACAWIGLLPTTLLPLLSRAVACWAPRGQASVLAGALAPLAWVSLSGWLLLALLVAGGYWLGRRTRNLPKEVGTWGCGFQFPAARMQYTASSFADFLVRLFHFGLRSERHDSEVIGPFPGATRFASHTPDLVLDRLLLPGFLAAARLCRQLSASLHNGVIAFYLLYIALTVIALLALILL